MYFLDFQLKLWEIFTGLYSEYTVFIKIYAILKRQKVAIFNLDG